MTISRIFQFLPSVKVVLIGVTSMNVNVSEVWIWDFGGHVRGADWDIRNKSRA